MYGHAAVFAGIVAAPGIHRELYLTTLGQLHQNLAHCVVGDLDALTHQPLVDGGALQVSVGFRSLLDLLRPLTDDGFDLPAQLPAHIFGHAGLLISLLISISRTRRNVATTDALRRSPGQRRRRWAHH